MNPILRIVNYLFQKNNLENAYDTFDSFFNNGIAFPQFIEIIFNEKIPQIIKNPLNAIQKKENNKAALQFLFEKNEDIAHISPDYTTEKDKELLLTLILTKQCFKINHQKIISKCNLIVSSLNIQYQSKEELLDQNCILALLNILTKGKVPIYSKIKDFDLIMKNSFLIAKVPQVIDKTSFEEQYQFTFYIQILIIFDVFSDEISKFSTKKEKRKISKIEKEKEEDIGSESDFLSFIDQELENDYKNSVSHQKKNKSINQIEKEKLNDEALLRAINAIGSLESLQFQTITYAMDNIIKFAKIFFKEKEDFLFLSKLSSQIKGKTEKINDFIKFLGQKEPIFNVYVFNFTENKFKKSSASLFFTKFLDHFFLRQSKQKMIERCKSLLFTDLVKQDTLYPLFEEITKDPKNKNVILFNWNVYLSLVYYANNKMIHFNINKAKKEDYSFNTKNIPQIIDENYLNLVNEDYSPIYYQLQFIFDAIDGSKFTFPIKNFKPTEKHESFDELQTDQPKFEKKNDMDTKTKILSSEEFWNQNDDKYSFENGILFLSKSRKDDSWNNALKQYKSIPKSHENLSKSEVSFDMISSDQTRSKLYKFFYYDEDKKKWEKNSESINQFIEEMYIKHFGIKTSLILFLNSYENEMIKFNSKLIQLLYPTFDDKNDNQIFVYALCGKPLSLLNYKIDYANHDSTSKPIFLFLHVPDSKMKLKNIQTIVYQIYFYLSIISDIEIVILNKEHYNDQIDLLKNISQIQNSIKVSANKYQKSSSQDIKFNDNFEIFSNEEDEDDNDNINSISQTNIHIFSKQLNYIVLFNNESIKGNNQKMTEIEFFEYIRKSIDENNCYVHFINIKEPVTYKDFLTTFNKLSSNSLSDYEETFERFDLIEMPHISSIYFQLKGETKRESILEEIIRKRFIQIKQIFDGNQLSDFDLLTKLKKELSNAYPSIDSDFNDNCNSILLKFKKEISQNCISIISTKLEESSQNNLILLRDQIYSQDYWSEVKKENIRIRQEKFLKKEFFKIISYLYPEKYRVFVFEERYLLLENQIDEDRRIIDKFFSFVENNQVNPDNHNIVDISDKRKRGTNYMIRENENIQEIEVVVEEGKLEDIISQDF